MVTASNIIRSITKKSILIGSNNIYKNIFGKLKIKILLEQIVNNLH